MFSSCVNAAYLDSYCTTVRQTQRLSHRGRIRNYGPFNTAFRQKLDVVVQNRITANKLTSLPPWIVGIVVFGGTDPESKKAVDRNAFEDAFDKESYLYAWAKVGEAPCTI